MENNANAYQKVALFFDTGSGGYNRLPAGLPDIDFNRLQLVRTTFVGRDFRHVEADVVLTAPLHPRGGAKQRTVVWLYLLIEHQSEPDALMPRQQAQLGMWQAMLGSSTGAGTGASHGIGYALGATFENSASMRLQAEGDIANTQNSQYTRKLCLNTLDCLQRLNSRRL